MKVAAEVVMYATGACPYCHRAEALLRSKGVNPTVIRVDQNPALRREMQQRAHGRHTVPQIFINGLHVGGSDDLAALNHRGGLDSMLQTPPQA